MGNEKKQGEKPNRTTNHSQVLSVGSSAAAGAKEEPAGGAPPPLMVTPQLPGTSHPATLFRSYWAAVLKAEFGN